MAIRCAHAENPAARLASDTAAMTWAIRSTPKASRPRCPSAAMSARVRSSPRDGLITTTQPPPSSTPSSAASCGGRLRNRIPTLLRPDTAAIRRASWPIWAQLNHWPSYSTAGASGRRSSTVAMRRLSGCTISGSAVG
ncbi:hypothetical protein C1Y40_02200 [Mycobacterium talmoniae]|uniref:Uncharacterized protein n=1 Tax=Mycobacterium talmoniae TaxID=1858794 RepID=A0A2S8BLU2_9MYCO|nr:hypothetical protein C1Y40_02200 [Mycobacterium talmoniae]